MRYNRFRSDVFSEAMDFEFSGFSKWPFCEIIDFEMTDFFEVIDFEMTNFSKWPNYEVTNFEVNQFFKCLYFRKWLIFRSDLFFEVAHFSKWSFISLVYISFQKIFFCATGAWRSGSCCLIPFLWYEQVHRIQIILHK